MSKLTFNYPRPDFAQVHHLATLQLIYYVAKYNLVPVYVCLATFDNNNDDAFANMTTNSKNIDLNQVLLVSWP